MFLIDFHVDTLHRLYNLKKSNNISETLLKNNGQIDIERLKSSNYLAQMFACFVDLGEKSVLDSHYSDVKAMIDMFDKQVNNYADKIAIVNSYEDYLNNKILGKISGILTLEEGGVVEGHIERLDELFNKGIRVITLTWNYENCIGYPNFELTYQNEGLKPFGVEAVAKMNELGIIIDVSHLSDAGFYDVYKYSKKPFMATHSNARSVTNHNRNLTDDMIKKISEKGGIIGLNFCASFLSDEIQSNTDYMVEHLRHIINVGGLEVAGLGTDFDGISDNLQLKGAQDMYVLIEALEKAKFKLPEIEAICYKNAENFMQRCL